MIDKKTYDNGLSLIAFLAMLVRQGKMPIGHLLSYLYDSTKPFTYFGKTIDSLDLKAARK